MREFQSRMAFDGSAAAGLGPACALARLFDADAYFKLVKAWAGPGPLAEHRACLCMHLNDFCMSVRGRRGSHWRHGQSLQGLA